MGNKLAEKMGLARRGAPPEFLYKLLGKRVTIVQTNEDIITGTILGYSRYEILFKQDSHEQTSLDDEEVEELTFILFKHAITAIIPEEDGVFDRKVEEEKSAYAGDNEQPASN
jgi:sRNA-binding regulator protein Hfq